MAPRQGAHELVHPFELTVFHARVHYWSGDPLGYVDALSRILARCKASAREEGRIVAQRRELGKVVRARGGDVESSTRSEQASEDKDDVDDDEDDEDEAEDENEDGDGGKEHTEESTESEVQDEEREEPDDVLVAAEANLSMWLERIARVCLILASQMIEMNVGLLPPSGLPCTPVVLLTRWSF